MQFYLVTYLRLFYKANRSSGCIHARSQDFFKGWAMRGLKDRSPPAGSRGRAPVGTWVSLPEAGDVFLKYCITTSSTETLDNIYSTQNTLQQHFQGMASAPLPLPMPVGADGRIWPWPLTFLRENWR